MEASNISYRNISKKEKYAKVRLCKRAYQKKAVLTALSSYSCLAECSLKEGKSSYIIRLSYKDKSKNKKALLIELAYEFANFVLSTEKSC